MYTGLCQPPASRGRRCTCQTLKTMCLRMQARGAPAAGSAKTAIMVSEQRSANSCTSTAQQLQAYERCGAGACELLGTTSCCPLAPDAPACWCIVMKLYSDDYSACLSRTQLTGIMGSARGAFAPDTAPCSRVRALPRGVRAKRGRALRPPLDEREPLLY